MIEYERRVTEITVVPKGKPLFDECATRVKIDYEPDGEFIEVTQCSEGQSLRFDPNEWEVVKEVITEMIAKCRDYDEQN